MATQKDEKTKTRKRYHTPEISVYGTLSQITQSHGIGNVMDNTGKDASKTG
jgi:hypothetical protein